MRERLLQTTQPRMWKVWDGLERQLYHRLQSVSTITWVLLFLFSTFTSSFFDPSSDKKFHVEHFTCSICPTLFGPQDSYYEHDGEVYCHFHYSTRFATKCPGCSSAILKQFVEINRNMRDECWHPECYMINKVRPLVSQHLLGFIPQIFECLVLECQSIDSKIALGYSTCPDRWRSDTAACIPGRGRKRDSSRSEGEAG